MKVEIFCSSIYEEKSLNVVTEKVSSCRFIVLKLIKKINKLNSINKCVKSFIK